MKNHPQIALAINLAESPGKTYIPAMEDKLKLHSYRRCPFAMRVRMVLHEKSLSFETVEESLKNKSVELRQLHPEGKVPLLIHSFPEGDRVVYESSVITEYLDEAFPNPPLMPPLATDRAECRLWTHWCDTRFKVDIDRLKYGTSRSTAEECQGADERLRGHLSKLETSLSRSEFLVGNSLTLADIHVFPFYRQLARINPAPAFLKSYPGALSWAERMAARPSFIQTMA
ncbi:MAG: glutathione S-transferase family protein [Deltaproteobacteria bacterium]|nr:glutathione S-transferase family protein [Deltaproteobacteria bacterium]